MKIAGTDYLPNHKALCFFVSGCNPPHCQGCHNPELWDFDKGEDWVDFHFHVPTVVENFWVMGGEPMHQDRQELIRFLSYLRTYNKTVMLWTRNASVDNEICSLVDYIKVGMYMHRLPSTESMGIKLASANQKVYKV